MPGFMQNLSVESNIYIGTIIARYHYFRQYTLPLLWASKWKIHGLRLGTTLL